MKLFKQVTGLRPENVSKPLSYKNIKAIRYCLYDNAPELGKPCLHRPNSKKSRYKLEVQIWDQEHNKPTGNIKLNGYLSSGKVFRQTKDYKRLQPYRNWYEEIWETYKNMTQMNYSQSDLVGYTCMLEKQQNGTSYGNTIIPQMTAMVIVEDNQYPTVLLAWNDLGDLQMMSEYKDKETYDIFYHYKPMIGQGETDE